MKKLNILLISVAIPPDFEDGASKFFSGIFNYLRKRHEVTLLTSKWYYKLDDPSIHQISIPRQRFLWYPKFTLEVLKYLKSHKFDIIHGNGPKCTPPILLSGNKRFISTIHDLGPFETRFTLFPVEKYLIKHTIKKATYITTCSEVIRRKIKYYIPHLNLAKIFNLYSAIEDQFKPRPKEAKQLKQDLGIEGPVLLYIGRIAHYKGVSDIIKAYKMVKKNIPDINLVMVGKPDFVMEKIFYKWKKKYKDIHFIGFVPSKELPFYYTLGDIFITYSYTAEGFGLTPIEAIACGTPVIVSSLPAYKEVLKNNAIFVKPRNPELLAKEIITLIKNEIRRKELIKKAQSFIKRYSWAEVGKKLEEVYLKLV